MSYAASREDGIVAINYSSKFRGCHDFEVNKSVKQHFT